jgi:phytoene desaturase
MASPSKDSYDVVVVGGGLGGLSAGACLARDGRRVLLCERQDGVGGNAHAFKRGPYTFDPAIHVTAHGYSVEFLSFYLQALGLADKIELIPTDTFHTVVVQGERFHLPIGTEPLKEALAEHFPESADGVRAFVQTAADATIESQQPPPRVPLAELEEAMKKFPTLFKYRTATLQDVLDEHLDDPRAKAVCGGLWPYMGVPPQRVSFMAYEGAYMAFCDPGPQYVRGSFQALADGVAEGITDYGGEIVTSTRVTRIVVEDGRVRGVELEGGERVNAEVVVSNSDARLTFDQLIGEEHLPPRFVKKLRRMKPSISGFLLYSAAKIDPLEHDLDHEVMVFEHWDPEEEYAQVLEGKPGGTWLSIPTLMDPGLAPEGEHLVIFTSLMPYDIGESWEKARPRLQEEMIERVEKLMPGYRDSITFVDTATPKTFEDYTLAQQGAIYGWENVPNQTVPKRLDPTTPIEGLWLTGHWTHPGTGSIRCLLSGALTAARVTGRHDPIELLGSFASAEA